MATSGFVTSGFVILFWLGMKFWCNSVAFTMSCGELTHNICTEVISTAPAPPELSWTRGQQHKTSWGFTMGAAEELESIMLEYQEPEYSFSESCLKQVPH